MKAKKSLGQNFLRDGGILNKIVDFAQIKKGDTVVEVGPGEGTLTSLLLKQANKVIAVEKDEELVDNLKQRFKDVGKEKLEIICGDILDIENLLKIENFVLVGNIPYYITGEIFRKFLQSDDQPKSLTFVIQKEVAERIIAKNGKESVLSISIKAYGTPQYGGVIKAGSFVPKPKVDSAIIAVRNINKIRFENWGKEKWKERPIEEKEKRFFGILKKGFAHKRKLLAKNLGISKETLQKLDIPPKSRAEKLQVEDWFALTKNLEAS